MRGRREHGFTMLEILITIGLLGAVLVIVMSFLVSAERTAAVGTARVADDGAAKSAMAVLEADVRYATGVSISSDGSTLYVAASSPACAAWSASSGDLVERTSSTTTSVVTQGISNLAFTGSSGYQGLVTISFDLALPKYASTDTGGTHMIETLSAQNMTGPVQTSSTPACSLP